MECCCSVTKSCLILCDPMNCSTPGFPLLYCLLEFAHIHVHWVGDAIQPSHLLLPIYPLPSILLSISIFQWVCSLYQVAKVLELQLQHQSFQWISGLISFKINWFDLLAIQGNFKILQHNSSKASVLRHSTFFMVQVSNLYTTTGKTIALTIHIDLCQQSDVSAFWYTV